MTSTPARPVPRRAAASLMSPDREARLSALLLGAIIASAVLTPAFTVSARLPDLRLEQVLAVPALGLLLRRLGWRRWLSASEWKSASGLVTMAFLGFALATFVSIVYAAAVLGDQLSPRDGYEVVKLGLYWMLFRFGLATTSMPRGGKLALCALLGASTVSAAFALLQYFDAGGVNRAVAGWWAPAHHLVGLERDARAFGTFANPNHFGAAMAITAVLGALACSRRDSGLPRGLVIATTALSVLGVVLSGSRGALGLLVIGGAVASGLMVLRRSAPLMGMAVLAAAFVASVAVVQILPRGREDYLTRVAGVFEPGGDSSLQLRLERWREALNRFRDRDEFTTWLDQTEQTGRPEAPFDARARDQTRLTHLDFIANMLKVYREQNGHYPPGPALAGVMDPLLPDDPLDDSPYRYERTATGYTVAATIEDPANAAYPTLAIGDARNYIHNASVEETQGGRLSLFRTLSGTRYRVAPEAALYGDTGIVFQGNPSQPGKRAAVYQQRHFGRPGGTPFTAVVWVKLPVAVQGEVSLYVNVLYTDGTRQDPFARVAADPLQVGVWQRLSLTFTPDAARTIDFVGVYLLSDDFVGAAYADGFELVDGSVPVRFSGLPEAATASLGLDAGSRFRRSPVFGVGPAKADGGGTVDNEYLLVAARHGVVGLVAYLALWLAVFGLAVEQVWRHRSYLAAGLAGVVIGLLAFNLVAGSLYQLQLMGLFWPVAGAVLAAREAR
jgi:O-antigen ligase